MSTDYPIEMVGTDRPNRFQVNAVTPSKRIPADDIDGELLDDEDTFNDDDIVLRNNRRSSRYVLIRFFIR